MKKQLSILSAAVLALSLSASAQALTTGDIAFTSFNADEDGWSLVTFVDIAANTTIYFTDNEATSATAFNGFGTVNAEMAHLWSTGASTIAAGSVIRFSAVDSTTKLAASFGNLSLVDTNNLGLSATNETVYAYLGTSHTAPTTLLAAVSSEGSTNLTPAGLTVGINAVILTNSTDYAQYNGPRAGETTFAAYAPKVNIAANWNILVGGTQEAQIPNTTAFTITAVPEPESYALLLAGLGLLGFIARRRKN